MQDALLEESVSIVTGAGGGIGRAIAEAFADEGATVVIADVDVDGGEETVERIRDDGGTAEFVETDVTDEAAVESAVSACRETYGSLDVLVNNAGTSVGDDALHRLDLETWQRMVDLNLTGYFRCAVAALRPMVETGGGSMVHISSVNGVHGIGLTGYSAAKSGILGLSRVIAAHYGRHGVRSNVICPGTIDSPALAAKREDEWSDELRDRFLSQYPVGRFGRPDEVADAALFLASDLSTYVTGTELIVDGGLTSSPDHQLLDLLYDIDDPTEW